MSNTARSDKKTRGERAPRRLFLDYAAGAPLSPGVRCAMEEAFGENGNPSSLYEEGRRARALLERARTDVARVLNAAPEEIIFTGSGSESDALAVIGATRALRAFGRHVIVSSIEHKAVLKAADFLRADGFEVTRLPVGPDGLVEAADVLRAVRTDTVLVSVMYANNEIGTVEPIADIARAIARARGGGATPLYHADACQAPGQLPLDVRALGVDFMSVNAAKAYGPKGVGALFARRGAALSYVIGGEQEKGLRGGTESVILALGLASALVESESLRAREAPRLAKLRDLLIEELSARIPGVIVNGHRTRRLPNNVHVSIPGIEGEAALLLLDAEGIAAATGSACNSFDLAPSHVLLATGEDAGVCHGSIRFSLGRGTTREDVLFAARALADIAATLRGFSAVPALSAAARPLPRGAARIP